MVLKPATKYAVAETLKVAQMLGEDFYERVKSEIEAFNKEEDLIEYLIQPTPFYYEPGNEPTDVLEDIINKEGIILDEYVHMNHAHQNTDGKGPLSKSKLSILPLYVRANQQIALKEAKVATDNMQRNIAGQVSGKKSKSGSLTDSEIAVAVQQDADAILRELLGPASHDLVAKREMKQSIIKTGDVSLKKLPDDSKNKQSIRYFAEILRSYDIDTDLIEEPLKW